MKLILTIVCFLALWTAIKFVFLVFRRLGNKNNMNRFIDGCEDKMYDAADRVANKFRSKKGKEKPEVTIH